MPQYLHLKKPLQIELYNDTFFHPSTIIDPTTNTPTSQLDSLAFAEHQQLPLPPSPTDSIPTPPSAHTDTTLQNSTFHSSILTSQDKLFFIKFTPEKTLRPRWYLISVDLESTEFVNINYLEDFTYWCVFQARHPSDKHLSDEYARWWPEWHRYHKDSVTGDIVFGDRILFQPSRIPPKDKYIQWAEAWYCR